MRISDWSSDVCSSDLPMPTDVEAPVAHAGEGSVDDPRAFQAQRRLRRIGQPDAAACRSEAIVAGRESGAAVDPDPGPVDEAIDFRALEPWRQFRAAGEFEGTGKTPVAAEHDRKRTRQN